MTTTRIGAGTTNGNLAVWDAATLSWVAAYIIVHSATEPTTIYPNMLWVDTS